MANQSGTLTSSQGSAFIGTTPNDTITFTPSAGTYTVEYPLGTVAISASTSTQSLPVSGGQVRVTCASGSVAWAVSDGNDGTPLSQTELLSVRSSVSGAWNAASSGTWRPAALGALPRFSVSGGASGGTWALSYRNAAGTVTSDPADTVAAGVVDVSPVFLDDATEIMVAVTGTVTVEVK